MIFSGYKPNGAAWRLRSLMAAERFYPCFQLACWGDATPEAAIAIAMSEAYGRA